LAIAIENNFFLMHFIAKVVHLRITPSPFSTKKYGQFEEDGRF